jgi:hypothetical protein
MELPDDVLKLIKEYSMPFGLRKDWRLGSYMNIHSLLDFTTEIKFQTDVKLLKLYGWRQHIRYISYYM